MNHFRSDLIDLDVVVRRETEKAWGVADPFNNGEIVWLPKSLCEMGDIKHPQKTATLTCRRSLAEEKGLV